jgi:hypothetical protein
MDQTLTLFILFVYVPTIIVYALILQQLNIRSQRTQQHTLIQLRNLELHVHGIAQDVQYICRALNDEVAADKPTLHAAPPDNPSRSS